MAAKPYVANLLQTRCKLIILQQVCTRANLMANIKFASDLLIRISVDHIKLANGLQTWQISCKHEICNRFASRVVRVQISGKQ